ncbi:MAG: hypothetical protein R3E46_13530 [Sedimenticolaceae bacterium]
MKMSVSRFAAGALVACMYAGSSNAALLALGDDASAAVGLGFNFDFFGSSYNTINVNSNGNITFGTGDTDFSESVSEFLSDQPRIAGWWDDLNPAAGGSVDATGDANSMVVTFTGVPQFANTDSNNFSITLFSDGAIEIFLDRLTSTDGIVGISAGGGIADPGPTDFSAVAGPYSASTTRYELFNGSFDLNQTTLRFEPTAVTVPVPATLALVAIGMVGFRSRQKWLTANS